MGKVNIYLKWSYIGVTIVIAVISILLLGLTVFNHGASYSHEKMEHDIVGLHFLYVFATSTLLLATFGGIGVWKGNKWALIVFAVGGILTGLYLLVTNILAVTAQSQIENTLKNHYLNLLPLANASQNELRYLSYTQRELHCCGLESYNDWGNDIPKTCMCDDKSTNPCVDVADSQGDENWFNGSLDGQPVMIYSEPCLPIMITSYIQFAQIAVGLLSGFIIIWVLSVALCISILCQMNKKLGSPKVVYSQEATTGNYSTLTEAPDSDQT